MATWIYVNIAWRHQAITWTNVDLSSVRSSRIHQRVISQETPQPLIIKINLKINYLKSHSNLQGANELTFLLLYRYYSHITHYFFMRVSHQERNIWYLVHTWVTLQERREERVHQQMISTHTNNTHNKNSHQHIILKYHFHATAVFINHNYWLP